MNNYDYDNQPDPGDMPMVDPADTFDAEVHDYRGAAGVLFGRRIPNEDWVVPPPPGTFDPREDAPDDGPQPEDRPPF